MPKSRGTAGLMYTIKNSTLLQQLGPKFPAPNQNVSSNKFMKTI